MAKDGVNDFDSPWKDAIQQYLRAFLGLCFPRVEARIDWSREPEFLEQELRALTSDSELGTQYVDQLIRVWQLDGSEQWVLLHVEVQSQVVQNFPKRLFQYYGRLTDRYAVQVATLCLLTDDSESYRPTSYEWEFWDCRVKFEFPACKLLDFKDEALAASWNPIAVVIRAHLAAKKNDFNSPLRPNIKWMLVRGLYERGLSKEDIIRLYKLIDWLIRLPEALELEFLQKVYQIERSKRMPYISSAERFGIEKGLELGRESREQLLRRLIVQNVERRFGSLPVVLPERLSQVNNEDNLQKVFDLTWDSASLIEFEAGLDAMGF